MGSILSSLINLIPWMFNNPYESLLLFCVVFIVGYGFWRRYSGQNGTSSWKGGIWELFNPEKREIIQSEAYANEYYNTQDQYTRFRTKVGDALHSLYPNTIFYESEFPSGKIIDFYNDQHRIGITNTFRIDSREISQLQNEAMNLGVKLIQIPSHETDIQSYIQQRMY